MPRNGSGTYTLPASSWNPAVTGGTIESSAANTTLTDLANALTQSLSKDGQTVPTNDLQMGGFKLTNLANGTLPTDAATIGQIGVLSGIYATLSGNNIFTGSQIFSGPAAFTGSVGVSSTASITTLNFVNASGSGTFQLNSATTGSATSPNITLNRSASALAGQDLGSVYFQGKNSSGSSIVYADIIAGISDPTAASEDGIMYLRSVVAGTRTRRAMVGAGLYMEGTTDPGVGKINATDLQINGVSVSALVPWYYISSNFAFTNNSGTPNTKIDYNAAQIADSTNAFLLTTSSGTINLATTGADGLDTGALANSTPYWLYIIAKADGSSPKGLGSLSATAPTMPATYTLKRRIGAFITDSSAHVIPWLIAGPGLYMLKDPSQVALIANGSASATVTSPLPTGKKWPLVLRTTVNQIGATTIFAEVYDPDGTDQAAAANYGYCDLLGTNPGAGGNTGDGGVKEVTTNTSSQVKVSLNAGAIYVGLLGWRCDGL